MEFATPHFIQRWPVFVGLAALILPSLFTLARQSWSHESGAQGPIILSTGLWLITQGWRKTRAENSRSAPSSAVLSFVVSIALYIAGRAYDFISLEIAGLIAVLVSITALYRGWRAITPMWFPILYLSFLVPLPGSVLTEITGPIKTGIAWAASGLLRALHYPVAREGVTLYVAQYQLLVEDACSGLNSLFTLSALSLFYIYVLHRGAWRHAALLLLAVLPAAIFANFIRVIILILLTYYAGNQVAQSYLHEAAGLVVFIVALVSIYAADKLIQHTIGVAE